MMMKKSKKIMMKMIQVKPVEEDRRPSAVYLNVIVRGAKENGLPKVIIIIIISEICIIYRCEILLFAGVHREAGINWAQWLSRRGGGDHRPSRENQNSRLNRLYFVVFIFLTELPRDLIINGYTLKKKNLQIWEIFTKWWLHLCHYHGNVLLSWTHQVLSRNSQLARCIVDKGFLKIGFDFMKRADDFRPPLAWLSRGGGGGVMTGGACFG